ncbi:MAG: hypothetical protein PXY39_08645 [archaeon]|nr:hypothetical protein [archaeon]
MPLPARIKGLEEEFLKGINVHSPESRDSCVETIEFLRKTPIEWVRIHPIPSRRLRIKGPSGISHLDSIEKFAEAGFNLVIPIEVGVKENVGVINAARLRSFVDESYGDSFKAVKQIETRIGKYNRRIIYGVENEIDTKEWILQSLPSVAWRETPLSWLELSVNKDLKFKRLGHILKGIKEASPNSLTMVNFEADDPAEDWNSQTSFILAAQTVFSKMGFLEKDARQRMNNYRLDVAEAMRRLKNIDIIGLDNYPNYFTKIPPRGQNIGRKVNHIAHVTKKPVINIEFGYTREGAKMNPLEIRSDNPTAPQVLSAEDLQKQFFLNALSSIENSSSQGTFPWVLFLDPAHYYKPKEENGFSLLKIGSNRIFDPVPALDLYLNWLDAIETEEDRIRLDKGEISQNPPRIEKIESQPSSETEDQVNS